MIKFLFVMIGGAFGTGLRYLLSAFIYSNIKQPSFPYANLVISVTGSFFIGLLTEAFETRFLVSPTIRTTILTGVLGGYRRVRQMEGQAALRSNYS